jgi:hypothetical protein
MKYFHYYEKIAHSRKYIRGKKLGESSHRSSGTCNSLTGVAKKDAQNRPQYPYLHVPYLHNGASVPAETFRLFSTQMYVSPVGKPARSMRSIEQRYAVAGRGLGAIPPKLMHVKR